LEDISTTTLGPEGINKILLNHGQLKHLTCIFIPSPKKGVVTKCTNSTTALFPHTNKIPLRITKKQLVSYIGHETPMEQTGLSKGYGTNDQMTNEVNHGQRKGPPQKGQSVF